MLLFLFPTSELELKETVLEMQAMSSMDDDATITQLATAWVGVALVSVAEHYACAVSLGMVVGHVLE